MNKRPEVGVYYFPNYHVDTRNEATHGPNWTEWELVKAATPRFEGHRQPKVPLWGYEDEADPAAMARKIDAAADHGVNHFIFDWYWYNDGPYLHRGLNEGFLQAPNNHRLKFALMWANHDWIDIHPAKRRCPNNLQYPGAVTAETFERFTDYVVENYFSHPSYWKIEGRPYFSIYELMTLIRGLGGIPQTRAALELFREKTKSAGHPDLHLNAVVWGIQILPNEEAITQPAQLTSHLGVNSVASYVWVHHVPLETFPVTPYEAVAQRAAEHWRRAAAENSLPYYPNVTMGWDASPRTVQSDMFTPEGYPFMATMGGNTPQQFKIALEEVKSFLEEYPNSGHTFSINAWNEWTEGSYLEPDTVHGYGYLEAIREVFGVKE